MKTNPLSAAWSATPAGSHLRSGFAARALVRGGGLRLALRTAALLGLLAAVACRPSEPTRCTSPADCAANELCVRGACVDLSAGDAHSASGDPTAPGDGPEPGDRGPSPASDPDPSQAGDSLAAGDDFTHGDAAGPGWVWAPMATIGAPAKRRGHQALWTGSHMVIVGGMAYRDAEPRLGGLYSPAHDTWTPLPEANAPCYVDGDSFTTVVYDVAAAWTGSDLLLWCGPDAGFGGGLLALPDGTSWRPIATAGGPDLAPAVWTGSGLLVGPLAGAAGALYEPASDSWTRTAAPPTTSVVASAGYRVVWTGALALYWGGESSSQAIGAGARYDPLADTWTPLASAGAPAPRRLHSAVWTGSEMIVWGGMADGGSARLADGARYDPLSDSWQPLPAINAPSARERHSATWTGSEMIVWGGAHGPPYPIDKGRYDPASDSWTRIETIDDYRYEHSALLTGSLLIIWGGVGPAESVVYKSGGRFWP